MTKEDMLSMLMSWLERPGIPLSDEFARWVWWQGFLDTLFGVALLAGGALAIRHAVRKDSDAGWLGAPAVALGAWYFLTGFYALAMHQVAERISVLGYALGLLD